MEDLNAASLEDVKTWFKTYYGAANTVLVLAGDVDADSVLKRWNAISPTFPRDTRGPLRNLDSCHCGDTPGESVGSGSAGTLVQGWNIPPYGEAQNCFLDLAAT